jgi:hypothetical protein
MQLKLPVDVHLAVGDDGSFALVVGGLIVPISSDDFAKIVRNKPLENGRRKKASTISVAAAAAPKVSKPTTDWRAKRRAKGLCSWCDRKPAPGKKLCEQHLSGARKAAKNARVAKEKTAK